MENAIITTFTDPMMGLTYECEPIYVKLAQEFPGIEFRWIMSLLVRDVSDFMMSGETIAQYNKRLAKIYESEEAVGGIPIRMPDLRLFDEQHRSSLPLNLAYKAAQLSDPYKADEFLWRLRHATVEDVLPTTHFGEILKVVRKVGINEEKFTRCYQNGSAQTELEKDLAFTRRMNIRSLPAYLIQYGDKVAVVRGLIGYDEFVRMINELSDGKITPTSRKEI